ncbi:hypothetical protein [uncultured Alistipes sp.]|uniref:hypothetical protein n=1 Tax=uncultured Alistipes sp. TaxID=538949 RepID=UPI00260B7568|nr:hypothetical protein [uncultured Alistipes sp.]
MQNLQCRPQKHPAKPPFAKMTRIPRIIMTTGVPQSRISCHLHRSSEPENRNRHHIPAENGRIEPECENNCVSLDSGLSGPPDMKRQQQKP